MPGQHVTMTWPHTSATDAPLRYRKACKYEVFIPDLLASLPFQLDVKMMGMVSEAENAIRALNDVARPRLKPLARLLLRTESQSHPQK